MLAVLGLPAERAGRGAATSTAAATRRRARAAGMSRVPLDRLAPAGEKIRIGFELYRAARPRPAGARDDRRRRGRPRLLVDRQPRLLPRARPAADGPARPAARRRPRDRAVRPARLPGAAPHGRRLHPPRRAAAPPSSGRASTATTRAPPSTTSPTCSTRSGSRRRPLRRLLRLLLRPGVRGQPPGPPALARPRRHVSAARHRPRARRPRRGHLARAAARVRAPAELRGARRGSASPCCSGSSSASARGRCAAPAPTPRAARIRVRLDIPALATLVQSGYGNLPMYRDLFAAIRAFEDGDRAPLLRLVAETKLVPDASPVRSFSDPLYLAVTCHDYPQMWDPAAPLATRRQQLAAARAALPPAQFAPFTGAEWTSLPYEGATACLRWPGPPRPEPPVRPAGALSGGPDAGGQRRPGQHHDHRSGAASSRRGSRARPTSRRTTRSTSPRSAIATAAPPRSCAASSARLSAGDTSCAGRIAEVRMVDRFPRRSAGAAPARSAAGRPQHRGRPPRRRRRGGHGRRRDPALAAQLRRQLPRPARRALDAGAATASRASASAARASPATSRCTAARPGGWDRRGPRATSRSPAAAGCGRAGTSAARSRRPRSPAASAAAACGRRCSRPERRRARAACAARACMEEGSSSGGLDRPRALVARGSGHQVES